jgi:hypothetical protein
LYIINILHKIKCNIKLLFHVGSKDLSARIYFRILSKKMAMTALSGHRDEVIGAYIAQDNETAYTIAKDGAIFTWIFETHDRKYISSIATVCI